MFLTRHKYWSPTALLLLGFCLLVGCQEKTQNTASPTKKEKLLVPEKGAYTGAYIDFGETEDNVSLEAIEQFEKMVGKLQAIIASSSYWGEQSFPRKNLEIINGYGAIPLVYWSPWDKPYEQNRGPELYKKAYRYVVDRIRAQGAHRILWVFHANAYSYPNESWNYMKEYYPGDGYVDWLGLSVYGQQFHQDSWATFFDMMDYPYREIAQLSADKPIMLAEWGIGEFPTKGSKAIWIQDAFREMPRYPRLKAAVFWHERWQNKDESYSNLRVNSSPEAQEAYRLGVADFFWLPRPLYQP